MMVLMEHPQHGLMHVYSDAQLADNLKNGWIALDPVEHVQEQGEEQVKQSGPVEIPVKRGRGRPKKVK